MDLPTAKLRQDYVDEIKVIEANIKDIASGLAPQELYQYSQDKLDKLADRFQHDKHLGTALYKLYELQAMLYYFQNRDDDALKFIQQAIETKGSSYHRAEKLIQQIQSSDADKPKHDEYIPLKIDHDRETNINPEDKALTHEMPLQLQYQINSLRTSTIIMAVITAITIYLIPWAVFYIILANKLKQEKLPNRKLIKWAAIATLPICFGLIPILVDIELWRMNKRLLEYEKKGSKAFISDQEFLASDKRRKKRTKRAWTILLSLIAIIVVIVIIATVSSNSNSTNNTNSFLNSESPTPYTSVEHGFVINFPGFPTTEHQNIQESGISIPYTSYTADINNGNRAYLVGVYDLTGNQINETGALEGAVNGGIQNTKGATLINSNFSTFLGLKSIDAYYTTPIEGTNYNCYMKGFIKNSKMYSILTIGEDKSVFNTFVNSFNFK